MQQSQANGSTTFPVVTLADLRSEETAKLTPVLVYTAVLMVMGTAGNLLVCYVYGVRWQSTVTKRFILCLALLDLTNSLVCMPTELVLLASIVDFDAPEWCAVSRFLTYTLNGSSSLILASIALDRWYKVCRPMQYFFNERRARLTCLGSVLLAASLSWPALFLYGNLRLPVAGNDVMGVTCLVSDAYIDTHWPLLFYSLYFACYVALVVAITVLYSLLAVRITQLKRRQKQRRTAEFGGGGLRSSKLVYASQEIFPLAADDEEEGGAEGKNNNNNNNNNDSTSNPGNSQSHRHRQNGECRGVRIQMLSEETRALNQSFRKAVAAVRVVPYIHRLASAHNDNNDEEEEERRRRRSSLNLRLPFQLLDSDDELSALDGLRSPFEKKRSGDKSKAQKAPKDAVGVDGGGAALTGRLRRAGSLPSHNSFPRTNASAQASQSQTLTRDRSPQSAKKRKFFSVKQRKSARKANLKPLKHDNDRSPSTSGHSPTAGNQSPSPSKEGSHLPTQNPPSSSQSLQTQPSTEGGKEQSDSMKAPPRKSLPTPSRSLPTLLLSAPSEQFLAEDGGDGGVETTNGDPCQGNTERSRLLPPARTGAGADSQDEGDTDEFERGIHFVPQSGIQWQLNPIVDEEPRCPLPHVPKSPPRPALDNPLKARGPSQKKRGVGSDAVVVVVTGDVEGGDDAEGGGSDEVFAAGGASGDVKEAAETVESKCDAKPRVQKTQSDTSAIASSRRAGCGIGDTSADEEEEKKTKLRPTMSDSANLLNTQGGGSGGGGDRASLTSRGSFLLPPGGYPGGRTPTSRLPSPAGTPSPGGKDPRSAPLTGALIMERLSKKMAYRPAKTTRMLVAISAVFVGSFLPFFIVVLIRGTHGRAFLGSLSDVEVVLVNLFIRSSFISNAVNPVIYGLCNKQFRTECRRLIGRCCNRKRDVNLPVFEQTDDVLASTNNYVK